MQPANPQEGSATSCPPTEEQQQQKQVTTDEVPALQQPQISSEIQSSSLGQRLDNETPAQPEALDAVAGDPISETGSVRRDLLGQTPDDKKDGEQVSPSDTVHSCPDPGSADPCSGEACVSEPRCDLEQTSTQASPDETERGAYASEQCPAEAPLSVSEIAHHLLAMKPTLMSNSPEIFVPAARQVVESVKRHSHRAGNEETLRLVYEENVSFANSFPKTFNMLATGELDVRQIEAWFPNASGPPKGPSALAREQAVAKKKGRLLRCAGADPAASSAIMGVRKGKLG